MNRSIGCFVGGISTALVLGLLAATFLYVRSDSSMLLVEGDGSFPTTEVDAPPLTRSASFPGSNPEAGTVILGRDALNRSSVPEAGEEITLERFAAFMLDETSTELSREAFRKVARQASVSWLLRLENVAERDGILQAEFEIPWQIHEENSTTTSSISVPGEFTEESRAALLKLRRGHWVTVEGQLSFDQDPAVLKNARIAAESPAVEVE